MCYVLGSQWLALRQGETFPFNLGRATAFSMGLPSLAPPQSVTALGLPKNRVRMWHKYQIQVGKLWVESHTVEMSIWVSSQGIAKYFSASCGNIQMTPFSQYIKMDMKHIFLDYLFACPQLKCMVVLQKLPYIMLLCSSHSF